MGRKHKENVRDFYQKWMEEQAQKLIDQTSMAFIDSSSFCLYFSYFCL